MYVRQYNYKGCFHFFCWNVIWNALFLYLCRVGGKYYRYCRICCAYDVGIALLCPISFALRLLRPLRGKPATPSITTTTIIYHRHKTGIGEKNMRLAASNGDGARDIRLRSVHLIFKWGKTCRQKIASGLNDGETETEGSRCSYLPDAHFHSVELK